MFYPLYGGIIAAASLRAKPDASSSSSSKNKLKFLHRGLTSLCVVDGCLSYIVYFAADLSQLPSHISNVLFHLLILRRCCSISLFFENAFLVVAEQSLVIRDLFRRKLPLGLVPVCFRTSGCHFD